MADQQNQAPAEVPVNQAQVIQAANGAVALKVEQTKWSKKWRGWADLEPVFLSNSKIAKWINILQDTKIHRKLSSRLSTFILLEI